MKYIVPEKGWYEINANLFSERQRTAGLRARGKLKNYIKKEIKNMSKNVDKMKQNLEVVKQYLTQQGKEFQCDDKGVITLDFGWEKIIIQVSDELVDIQVHRTARICKEMEEYLNKLNSILKEGRRFEIEPGKTMNYRIAFPVEEEMLQLSEVGDMWETVLWMANYVLGPWFMVSVGSCSAKEAFMRTIIDIRDEEKLERYIDSEIMSVVWESIISKMEQAIMKYIVLEKRAA